MPQDQDFRFQPALRLEAVAQHADEEETNCDHQSQSCSDSPAAVTPADGGSGSDRRGGCLGGCPPTPEKGAGARSLSPEIEVAKSDASDTGPISRNGCPG